MSRAARIGLGTLLVALGVVALGVLTRVQYAAVPDRAQLRLAWRALVPRVEECRRPTPEEQEELPIHMRQDEICEGRLVSYRLVVTVDGAVRLRSTVEAAGARGDRPLYVFEELPLESGPHDIRIVFERIDAEGAATPEGADGAESDGGSGAPGAGVEPPSPRTAQAAQRRGSTVPDRLVLDRRIRVESHDVALVGYDADARELVLRGAGDG